MDTKWDNTKVEDFRGVWVFCEQRFGRLMPTDFELLSEGRKLADELGTTVPNLSQHLRVLKDLGLVRGERRGLRIHYFLVPERLAQYQRLARELLGNAFSAGIGAMSPHGQEPPAHEPADPSSTIA